ncbi:ABC transporter permease [Streptomyces sp. NPDC051018]|uniref:ABC transporter permease n=1 Tax=Streptomyces sp. NPDC051018 TaxID=3365639 RepID=UPI0037A5B0D4
MAVTVGAPHRLAVADFLDRARRPAYGATLATAVALGWLAVPAADARWVVIQIGDHRGVYNSAYTGTAIALAGALWLMLIGFYVVRNGVSRDHATGVGRLLTATPLTRTGYLGARFLSNVLVLGSMVGVLAVTALVLQLARGEDTAVDPVALLTPFAVVTLPAVILTAACALLFEAVPLLGAGLGNVVWFFVWMVLAMGGQGANAPLGGIGVHDVVRSMRDDVLAGKVKVSGEFSLGLTLVEEPLRTFVWDGYVPDGAYLLDRAGLVLVAVALALVPALWFHRFDPDRVWVKRIAALVEDARSRSAGVPGVAWPSPYDQGGGQGVGGGFQDVPVGETRGQNGHGVPRPPGHGGPGRPLGPLPRGGARR